MSFLTPLYLLAGLAVLAPILAHLIRSRPRDVIDFSSVLFLDPSAPRLTNSSRIEQWMLLLLRSLILLALAFAFARPYLKTFVQQTAAAEPGKVRLLLIDASASMKRPGVWEEAIEKAKDYLSKSAPADSLAVYLLTDRLEPVVSLDQARQGPAQSQALALQGLDGLSPTWFASDIGKGLVQALELLSEEPHENDQGQGQGQSVRSAQIALASDFQQGSSLETLGSIQWPSDIPLIPLVCRPNLASNASVTLLSNIDPKEQESSDGSVRVAVRNSIHASTERFRLHWLDPTGRPLEPNATEVYVPAGQQQIVSMACPEQVDPRAPRILELQGDEQAFDNRQYYYRGRKVSAKAICIDSRQRDPKESLWYFALRVPVSQPGLVVQWEHKDPSDSLESDSQAPPRWVVASSDLSPTCAQRLKPWIEQGLHVLWVLDRPWQAEDARATDLNDANAVSVLKNWFDEDSIGISEADSSRYHLLQDIDMTHPVFSAFADPKYNNFSKVRFWHHRRMEGIDSESWRVLAKFDDGQAAMLQRPLGKGMVTVLTSGWQPIESQLALSSKFVPILTSLFELGNPPPDQADYRCGDAVPASLIEQGWRSNVRRFDTPGIFTLNAPSGESVAIESLSVESRPTDKPLDVASDRASLASQGESIAVNLPRSECITDPIDLEEFSRFGVPIDSRNITQVDRERTFRANQLAEQLEANQRGWWWLLLFVLLFAGLESVVTALRSRGRAMLTPSP
ncbi:MAG: BatA domain-containing protein [Planctomycetota bacterium]|nr:BatA domain-containing protein [Planctomycetota bacterium]